MHFLLNFIRFSRLHTIIGTTLSIVTLWLIALSYADGTEMYGSLLGLTIIACLGANIFIVGLNQITDIEIDKINKPYLPLASGAFSLQTGKLIVGIGLAVSLILAVFIGGYLLWTVLLSLALGIAYSLPPLRLKKYPFWAAFCIIAVRGIIVNLLLFLHFHAHINGAHSITPLVWLLTVVIVVYSLIIALFKDLPDTEGDAKFAVRTLSVRLGRRRVFAFGNVIMMTLFVLCILAPFLFKVQVDSLLFSGVHGFFLLLLLLGMLRTNLQNQDSVFNYYRFIWVLFFGEYLVFAFL